MVASDVFRLVEPPPRNPVQNLTFQRQRPEHSVERADTVTDDDDPLPVFGVVIADFAFVFVSERRKVGASQRMGEGTSETVVTDASHGGDALESLSPRCNGGNRPPGASGANIASGVVSVRTLIDGIGATALGVFDAIRGDNGR
jgi:hypothetical protein